MDRRNFLASAIAALGALAIDPEELIWRPSARTIFIPSEAGMMLAIHDWPPPNQFMTFEVLDAFLKQLRSAGALDLAKYSVPKADANMRHLSR